MTILELARMMQFGDSVLPTGAFAFSSALEAAVQKGVVCDAETLRQFTETAVEQAARGDGVGVAWAVRAARTALTDPAGYAEGVAQLRTVDQALFARKLPEEARSMTIRTGKKLAEMGLAVTETQLLAAWLERIKSGETPGTYPVTLAVLMASVLVPAEGSDNASTATLARVATDEPSDVLCPDFAPCPAGADDFVSLDVDEWECAVPEAFAETDAAMDSVLRQVLTMHLYGVAMGILNAALRLMRVTHTDTQAALFRLASGFEPFCLEAASTPLGHMSNFAPMTDILSAVHARAHVRLFMS